VRGARPTFVVIFATCLAVAGAAGGCGEERPAAMTAEGHLTVTLDDGRGRVAETPVACDDASAFCAELRMILAEPADLVCTQIYGGPERILVRGTLDGAPVGLTVTRTDGCEIDRYDRLVAALPATDG
jgi:hypothetical protein